MLAGSIGRLFNSHPDPIFICTLNEGKIVEVNESFLHLTGYTRNEVIDRTYEELGLCSVWGSYHPFKERLIKEGVITNTEVEYYLKSGEMIYLQLSAELFEIMGDEFILTVGKDITEQKRYEMILMAERNLGLALSTVSTLEDAMPFCVKTAISVTNMDCGGMCLINDETENLQLAYTTGLSSVYTTNLTRIISRRSEWLVSVKLGYKICHPDKKINNLWGEIVNSEGLKAIAIIPVFYEQKVIACLVVASHTCDTIQAFCYKALEAISSQLGAVLVRITAEEKLRQSEERYRNILSTIKDGYYEVDVAGNITFLNQSLSRIIGYTCNEILGTSYRAYCSQEVAQDIYSVYNRVYRSDEPVGILEGEMTKKDGSSFCSEISISPIYDEHSQVVGFRGIFRDITERKKAEEDIKKRNRQLIILNTIATTAFSSLELSELVSGLKQIITYNLNIAAGVIYFYDKFGEELKLLDCWHLPNNLAAKLTLIPLRVFKEGRVLIYEGMNLLSVKDGGYSLFDVIECIKSLSFRSFIGIPLLAEGEFQGVIYLFSLMKGAFDDFEEVFFTTLGQMVGVAMQKVTLFDQVRNGQEQMRTLSRKLMEIQESERCHLSRELHDGFGQELTALKINLQALQKAGTVSAYQLHESIGIIDRILQEIRQLSLSLRPSLLDDLGLAATLRWHIDYHARLSGLDAEFITNLSDMRLPNELETTCYRIVQEAFTNVVKHAHASKIKVELLQQEDKLYLTITDDGLGFDVNDASLKVVWGKSLGLLSMKERVALVGGILEIDSAYGVGTKITAFFPSNCGHNYNEVRDKED